MVWLNDCIVPAERAFVAADDWGFLYGDTLFETTRVVGAVPVAWCRHVRRLRGGSRKLRWDIPWSDDDLRECVDAAIEANELADAVVRLTISRGRNPHGLELSQCIDPTLVVAVRPYSGPPQTDLDCGIRAQTVRVPARGGWARYAAKTGNYLDMLLALDDARQANAAEAILVDTSGRVLEGTRSNVFVVRNGSLLTPPVRLGILPGVARGLVMEWARGGTAKSRTSPIHLRAAAPFDEAFVTNSVWGIVPVAAIDGRGLGEDVPGPITRCMMDRWDRYIGREAERGARFRRGRANAGTEGDNA